MSGAHGDEAEMLTKWREVREQIAADEADTAAKQLELHWEQAGLKAERECLAAVQQEVRDAGEQAASFDKQALAALHARSELELEMRVASKDALRLQASTLPSLQVEVYDAERALSKMHREFTRQVRKVEQYLFDVTELNKARAKEDKEAKEKEMEVKAAAEEEDDGALKAA